MALPQLDAAAAAQVESGSRGAAWLIELFFASATIRCTTWPVNVTALGQTFTSLYGLIGVQSISEGDGNGIQRAVLEFGLVNNAMLAMLEGPASEYRNRRVNIYFQVFSNTYQPVGAPVKRWSGVMDKLTTSRTKASQKGGSVGKGSLTCLRTGIGRSRAYEGYRSTDAQQQAEYPGDLGRQYMSELIAKPQLWLSKKFQEI